MKKIDLKLAREGTAALWDLLRATSTKGRSEMRHHAHVWRALERKGGGEPEEETEEEKKIGKTRDPVAMMEPVGERILFRAGTLAITRDGALEYLRDILTAKIDKEIPGNFNIGYCDLYEVVSGYFDAKEKSEEKAREGGKNVPVV